MVNYERLFKIWGQTISLSWPISVQQALTTLMRTVDIVVAGIFGPAYVTAVGLADLYAQIPLRIGFALGAGAIALSSQDTGRKATTTRDRAITQAFVIGILAGMPLIAVGYLLSESFIAILGAEQPVVRLGATYLTLVFAAAPMRILGLIGARSLQGTGDTVTPMIANGGANFLNATGTVVLALGIGPLPRLGIIGIGLATLLARTIEAVAITAAIVSPLTELSFARPQSMTITHQIIRVSVPNFAEGMSTSLANFPFNSLLLLFGTEVNAAYHIGRRIYQQFTGPLYRAFRTTGTIVVGQYLGEGEPKEARYAGFAITALSTVTMGAAGVLLIVGANPIASIFTNDSETLRHAIAFTRIFGISMFFFGVFFPFAGCLQGAGDTRTPFYARAFGTFVFMLSASYLLAIPFGWGLLGIYVGIVVNYCCWAVIVAVGFIRGDWAEEAAGMMAERDRRPTD